MSRKEQVTVNKRFDPFCDPRGDAMAIARWQMADGKPRIQISGLEGGPIQIQSFDLKKLTTEELRQWRDLAIKAATTQAVGKVERW
jgi:hypothetical protein